MKKVIIILVFISIIYGCSDADRDGIKAPGMVEGEIITLKSRVSSSVIKISALEGEEVAAGDELVRFDSRALNNKLKDIELNLLGVELKIEKLKKKKRLADRNLRYLKNQVGKFERLSKKRSVSGDDLEKMKLKLLEAETTLFDINKSLEEINVQSKVLSNNREYLGIMLEDYNLTSGVSGIVMERFVSIGENVFPGSPIIDILDKKSMYVEIFIEEKELFAVKTGSHAKIIVDGADNKDLKGVVSEIGRKAEFSPKYVVSEVERKALLYKVKIRLSDNLDIFKIGMPVTIMISKKK
ncbi:MAG: efflux RND transporter periplasmic adaptor subunit [Acidobacteriota bacterium]